MSSESRSELIGWLNDLLQIGVSKIEQIGMGAIPCQVLDSIWGDVALHRVKFSASQEYEYLANWKVFQSAMEAHAVVKEVPVERLVKLRFQDNLEFCQWLKKFWDSNYQQHQTYDAVARRKSSKPVFQANSSVPAVSAAKRAPISSGNELNSSCVAATGSRNSPSSTANNHQLVTELRSEVTQLKVLIDKIEKERDFYFGKLRSVEVFCQQNEEEPNLKQILELLYSE